MSAHALFPDTIRQNHDNSVLRRLQQLEDQLQKTAVEPDIGAASPLSLELRQGHSFLQFEAPLGEGFMESLELPSGLAISRKNCRFFKPMTNRYQQLNRVLGFSLVLEGGFRFSIPRLSVSGRVRPGEVWVSGGTLDEVTASHSAGRRMCGVGLDLSPGMLEQWREEAPMAMRRKLKAGDSGMCSPLLTMTPAMQGLALKILNCPTTSLCARLEYESMGLALLAQLLSGEDGEVRLTQSERRSSRHRKLIRQAVDLLHAEWREPPTIAQLAMRIGMNECYLKTGFKELTGKTIAQYVRGLRMVRAYQLLTGEGYTVNQAAVEVGFSNPSHFSTAFRAHYGCLPSDVSRHH